MRSHHRGAWLWGGLLGLAAPATAQAATLSDTVQNNLQQLNTGPLNQYLSQLLGKYPQVPLPSIGEVVGRLLHRQNPLDISALWHGMLQAMMGDLGKDTRVVGLVLLLTVFAAVLERLTDSLETSATVDVARLVLVSGIMLVALQSFALSVSMVDGVVQDLVHLMLALVPVLAVLMVGSGAVASAGIFHPMMLATVNGVAVATQKWVLPLVLLATIIELVSLWLPRFSLKSLGNLMRQAGGTILGGLLAIFMGVMAVEGAAGAVADGVTLRTGKFLAATFIPVVGKVFSDAMEAVLGSSLLLKNAVSLVGALAIIVTVLFPLVKLFVMMLFFRLGAAGAEPLGVRGVAEALNLMAGSIGWLIAIAGAVALMFFLAVTVAVSASNGVTL